MIRTALALSSIVIVSACIETAEPTTAYTNDAVSVPNPIIMVGAAGPGSIAAAELGADGLKVETSFNGRAAGLTAFCSGEADALALAPGQDWTSAERDRCRELKDGWGWSALSTRKDIGLYVRFGFAADLLERATTAFR